jgi:hypothetical protein
MEGRAAYQLAAIATGFNLSLLVGAGKDSEPGNQWSGALPLDEGASSVTSGAPTTCTFMGIRGRSAAAAPMFATVSNRAPSSRSRSCPSPTMASFEMVQQLAGGKHLVCALSSHHKARIAGVSRFRRSPQW